MQKSKNQKVNKLKPVNDKNGGDASWGRWEQTKADAVAFIQLPAGTRAKMINVAFTSTAVSVKLLSTKETLMQGALAFSVIADECYWEIVDGLLELHFVKEQPAKACGRENPEGWWPCILRTDKVHDVTLCDKEPFLLGEMDDLLQNSMRSMIARMMGSDDPTEGKAPTLDPAAGGTLD